MRKYLIGLLFMSVLCVHAQESRVDPEAIYILDRVSDIIGELNSVSYHLASSMDEPHGKYGSEKQFAYYEVFIVGPDKMLVHSLGHNGHRGFSYNGSTFTFYSYDENNYATVPVPDRIIPMIDSIHENYGVHFPAADFFYPTLTEDILDQFDDVLFLGTKQVKGKDCFHILASSEALNLEIWVSKDALGLPLRFTYTYKDQPNTPQYNAEFSDWVLNPVLPATIFEFSPPPHSREVYVLPIKE